MENTEQKAAVLFLADSVIARIAQIVQEGMLMGTDVIDLLRQVEVVTNGTAELQLNPEYAQRVIKQYTELAEKGEAMHQEALRAEQNSDNG